MVLDRLVSPDGLFDIVIVGIVLLAAAVILWVVFVEGAFLSLTVG